MIRNNLILLSAATTITLGLAGCASSPERSDPQIAAAANSIEIAEENGGRTYGGTALDRAQEKLIAARSARDKGNDDAAIRLAEQASLDAELAAAQATHGKAQAALAQIRESIDTLNDELARSDANRGGHQ